MMEVHIMQDTYTDVGSRECQEHILQQ